MTPVYDIVSMSRFATAKRNSRIDKAVPEATPEGVGIQVMIAVLLNKISAVAFCSVLKSRSAFPQGPRGPEGKTAESR